MSEGVPWKSRGALLALLLLCDGAFFWLGLTRDAVTVAVTVKEEFLGFEIRLVDDRRTYSILDAIWKLKEDGNTGLFLVVGLFSVVFPAVKLLGNGWILAWGLARAGGLSHQRGTKRCSEVLATLSKWSMLEVFMAAMLCALLKAGDMVRLLIHDGMYWFLAAVLLSIVNATLTKRLLVRVRSAGVTSLEEPETPALDIEIK